MSLIQAIIMGIIQGITEFLPVSSSGHLALFKNLFHVNIETGILFDVLLHVGTLLAICIVFYKDILRMIVEGIGMLCDAIVNCTFFFRNVFLYLSNSAKKEKKANGELAYSDYRKVVNSGYRKFVMLIIVSTIPMGIIGIVGKKVVEQAQDILLIPGICLVLTAILLFVADICKDGDKIPKDITYSNAFGVGIMQGIAILPGLSRSGATITACLVSGFNRKFAVKYSFLMSIPAILGAMLVELKDLEKMTVSASEMTCYIVGMVIAAVVGFICIKITLAMVKNKKFRGFAIYCLILGCISIGGFFYLV